MGSNQVTQRKQIMLFWFFIGLGVVVGCTMIYAGFFEK